MEILLTFEKIIGKYHKYQYRCEGNAIKDADIFEIVNVGMKMCS